MSTELTNEDRVLVCGIRKLNKETGANIFCDPTSVPESPMLSYKGECSKCGRPRLYMLSIFEPILEGGDEIVITTNPNNDEWISGHMAKRGSTQTQVAEKIIVSRGYVSHRVPLSSK